MEGEDEGRRAREESEGGEGRRRGMEEREEKREECNGWRGLLVGGREGLGGGVESVHT